MMAVPFAVPAIGLNIVTVGITTFLTIWLGIEESGACIDCSCQVQFSEPGGIPEPGQIANTPAAPGGCSISVFIFFSFLVGGLDCHTLSLDLILFVADLFHPVGGFAIGLFHNGDVR